jgi:hypothetical protein
MAAMAATTTTTADVTTTYNAGTAINTFANQASHDLFFYNSFDLHFLKLEQIWECAQHYNPNTNTSYFDVVNGDVAQGYSYFMVGPFNPP